MKTIKLIALQDMQDAGLDITVFDYDTVDGRCFNGGDHKSKSFKRAKFNKTVIKITVTTTYYITCDGIVNTYNPKTNRTDK